MHHRYFLFDFSLLTCFDPRLLTGLPESVPCTTINKVKYHLNLSICSTVTLGPTLSWHYRTLLEFDGTIRGIQK